MLLTELQEWFRAASHLLRAAQLQLKQNTDLLKVKELLRTVELLVPIQRSLSDELSDSSFPRNLNWVRSISGGLLLSLSVDHMSSPSSGLSSVEVLHL
jgi:hypothetical protein